MKWILIIVGLILFGIVRGVKKNSYKYKVINKRTKEIEFFGSYFECSDYVKYTKRIDNDSYIIVRDKEFK